MGARDAWLGCPVVIKSVTCESVHLLIITTLTLIDVGEKCFKYLVKVLLTLQLNLGNEFDYATYMSTTPGWAAHQIITVIKDPALAQTFKLVISIGVMENYLECILVGKLMDK